MPWAAEFPPLNRNSGREVYYWPPWHFLLVQYLCFFKSFFVFIYKAQAPVKTSQFYLQISPAV